MEVIIGFNSDKQSRLEKWENQAQKAGRYCNIDSFPPNPLLLAGVQRRGFS